MGVIDRAGYDKIVTRICAEIEASRVVYVHCRAARAGRRPWSAVSSTAGRTTSLQSLASPNYAQGRAWPRTRARSRRDSTGCFESARHGAGRVEPDYHDDGGASSLNSVVGVRLSLVFVFPRRLGIVVTVVDPAEVGNRQPLATGQPVERATPHAQAWAGTHCRTIARCPIVIKNSVFRYGETPFNLLEASAHLLHHFLHVPRYGGIAPR
jgi:hypothetical protein